MEDSVADDGQPLYFGDVITLYSTHHQGCVAWYIAAGAG